MRQVILDTETTGLSPAQGHRIIEIGCIELVNRRPTGREYHRLLNPERAVDEGAERVHGMSLADLENHPKFAEIAEELVAFIRGAELVIHNAEFDIGFLEHELRLMRYQQPEIRSHCTVLDTLQLARDMHPGQRNSLDALCKRYEVDNSRRDVHGALIDAELLANVYLAMTGGQTALLLDSETPVSGPVPGEHGHLARLEGVRLLVRRASEEERVEHEAFLERIVEAAGGNCLWRELEL